MGSSPDFSIIEPHGHIVADLLAEARGHPTIIGALLIGSLGRGNAVPGSDIDLLFLLADGQGQTRIFQNHEREGILIEFHYRDVATAMAQVEALPVWQYAYLGSRILYDPLGRLAILVDRVRAHAAAWRPTIAERQRHAFYADRVRHKLQAGIDAGDALRAGGIASTYAPVTLTCLWLAYDRPSVGVTEMWIHLADLVGLPEAMVEQLRLFFLADPFGRAHAGIAICAHAVERLGGPIIDPYAIEG
jgi:predicted nucleotidyltransferase